MSLLTNLTLHTLTLSIHLPGDSNKFMDEYAPDVMGSTPVPPLNVASTGHTAIQIADGISEYQGQRGDKALQTLRMHFSLVGYADRYQPFRIQAEMMLNRKVKGDAKMLGDQQWEISGKYEWIGGYS